MTLRLGSPGHTCDIPVDFATEAWAILARRGAGKSNGGAVIAEELHAHDLPFVVVDPKGDWWGIRSNAKGDGPGLAIPVFGGRHGDIPLEPGAGHLLADLVLGDQNSYLSCVLDVSSMTISEQRRFLTDFLDRLFKGKDEQGVLTLIFEEAHEYLPQVVPRESRTLVSVAQRIVKQGRQRGLGVGMLTQRSAALNKDVLTQIGALIPMWTMSPQDRSAIKAWVDVGGDAPELLSSLHSLKPGEAWLWWPEGAETPQPFTFRRRWTFDSGATPKPGHKRVVPRTLADVDLAAVKEAMAETIEKAKADDPKELRKRIRELERQLAERPAEVQTIEEIVPCLTMDEERGVTELIEQMTAVHERLDELIPQVMRGLSEAQRDPGPDHDGPVRAPVVRPSPPSTPSVRPSRRPPTDRVDGPKLGKTERTILTVLAQHGPLSHDTLALLSGYSAKASTIGVSLAKLRKLDLVQPGQPITATHQGVEAVVGSFEVLPTGGALVDYWRHRFGKTERAVLDAIISVHPNETSYAEIAQIAGYSPTASTVGVSLAKLRRVGVVDGYHLSDAFQGATGL